MIKSLFYKEWIKARKLTYLMQAVFAAVIAYILLSAFKQFQAGPIPLWESIIQNNSILVRYIRYLPLAAGILTAIVQFFPEMQNKRLKLTLHLPLNESKILYTMLGFGLMLLAGLFLFSALILMSGLRLHFCQEIVKANFLASLPWFLGGLAGYLVSAWICLEPVWKQRISNAVTGGCCVSFFYFEGLPGAYVPFIPYLLSFIVIGFFFSFYSTVRFKNGVQ